MTKINVRRGVRKIKPTPAMMFGKNFTLTINTTVNAQQVAAVIMGKLSKISVQQATLAFQQAGRAMSRTNGLSHSTSLRPFAFPFTTQAGKKSMGKRNRNRQRQKGLRKYANESQSDFEKRISAENAVALAFNLPEDIKLPTLWEARNFRTRPGH